MRAYEAVFSGNTPISATPANFPLSGGRYAIDLHASVWGTVKLNKLAQDGSTLLTTTPVFGADSTALVDLAPGIYQLTLAGVTNLVWCISRVPLEA